MKNIQHLLLAVAFISTIGAAGCGNEASENTSTATSQTTPAGGSATVSAPTVATAPYDLRFIDMMSRHHQSAIDMAKMAKGKVTSSGVKGLVKSIPVDQQKEIDQMKAWRDQWYPGAPMTENASMPGMSSGMNMDMSHMQSMKAGHQYDAMFIDMMIPHHESAVTMAKDALSKAGNPEIKTLAKQIIDAQTKEIDQMKKWKSEMAKGDSHKH